MNKSTDLIKIYRLLAKRFGNQDWWPGECDLEIIIGAILTQRTNWHNVRRAIGNLKKKRLMQVNSLKSVSESDLAGIIKPAGFYNQKAKTLLNLIDFISSELDGDLKNHEKLSTIDLREKLLKINGIGPETADSILLYGFKRTIFVVDEYTRRILSRIGIVADSIRYHDLQEFVASRIPESVELYNDFHAQFVNLGKTHCRTAPKCSKCPLMLVCNFGKNRYQ